MDDPRTSFHRNRYVVLRALLSDPELSQTYQYVSTIAEAGLMKAGDRLMPDTPCRYGDPVMDGLLTKLQPAIEDVSGLRLYPTYSYVRMYKSGDRLDRHTDRESCEISVTLCLGSEPGELWPIHIEGPAGQADISLNPGDALVYRGIECAHWRDRFDGQRIGQLFLHYVDQNGPYADWKFDRRASLSDIERWIVDGRVPDK